LGVAAFQAIKHESKGGLSPKREVTYTQVSVYRTKRARPAAGTPRTASRTPTDYWPLSPLICISPRTCRRARAAQQSLHATCRSLPSPDACLAGTWEIVSCRRPRFPSRPTRDLAEPHPDLRMHPHRPSTHVRMGMADTRTSTPEAWERTPHLFVPMAPTAARRHRRTHRLSAAAGAHASGSRARSGSAESALGAATSYTS